MYWANFFCRHHDSRRFGINFTIGFYALNNIILYITLLISFAVDGTVTIFDFHIATQGFKLKSEKNDLLQSYLIVRILGLLQIVVCWTKLPRYITISLVRDIKSFETWILRDVNYNILWCRRTKKKKKYAIRIRYIEN